MDKSIRTRLLSLQTSFFQSLQNGTDALAGFCQEMSGFNETLNRCAPDLDEETCLLIFSFTETCTAVIPSLIDLSIANEKINENLNEVFNQLSLNDTPYPAESEKYPPYLQPAHAWLLDNLHNPYPSRQSRTILSKQTNTPQKDIDSWFTDVRKRIGWNALRKKHFTTRKDMIATATRFFKPSSIQLDPRTELEDAAQFDEEFALLEDIAKNLYSRKFSATSLANKLDAVKDLTPQTSPAGQETFLARQLSTQEIEHIPESPFLFPEFHSPSSPIFLSPSPSPAPSPPPQPSSQSRKRCQSNSDLPSSHEGQPSKRRRINASANPSTLSSSPSTQSGARQISSFCQDSSPSSIPTNSISISERSCKRKRQSSDSDSEFDQGRMKRAHCTTPPPSNYLVESLPSGSSNVVDLDNWIKSLCGEGLDGEGLDLSHSLPEPVYETSPLSSPVEIGLYRYASSSPSSSVTSLGPSTPPDYNYLDSPTASHQSLSWFESPSLTKEQGYNGFGNVLLSTNWSEENFLFDLNSPGILDADFPSQNWDLGLTPATSANSYSISQVLQESVGNSTQLWTNEKPAFPISIPRQPDQVAPISPDIGGGTLPQVSQHPSLDKKGAKIRYLQTLLNEVQNVRFELAI